MNRAKWTAKDVPLQTLVLKLHEEVAEVGTILTDTMIVEKGEYKRERKFMKGEKQALRDELEHVLFIANTMLGRLS
jgi:hypothetical protein